MNGKHRVMTKTLYCVLFRIALVSNTGITRCNPYMLYILISCHVV